MKPDDGRMIHRTLFAIGSLADQRKPRQYQSKKSVLNWLPFSSAIFTFLLYDHKSNCFEFGGFEFLCPSPKIVVVEMLVWLSHLLINEVHTLLWIKLSFRMSFDIVNQPTN